MVLLQKVIEGSNDLWLFVHNRKPVSVSNWCLCNMTLWRKIFFLRKSADGCRHLLQDLLSNAESISPNINHYFTSLGNNFFSSINLNISLYDLPVILEPSKKFSQDIGYTASMHLDRVDAQTLLPPEEDELVVNDCISYLPNLKLKETNANSFSYAKIGKFLYTEVYAGQGRVKIEREITTWEKHFDYRISLQFT